VGLYLFSSYKPSWCGKGQLYVVQQVTEMCAVYTTAVVSSLQIGNNRPISTAEGILPYSKLNSYVYGSQEGLFYLQGMFCQLLLA